MNINNSMQRFAASTLGTLVATAICIAAAIGPGVAVA